MSAHDDCGPDCQGRQIEQILVETAEFGCLRHTPPTTCWSDPKAEAANGLTPCFACRAAALVASDPVGAPCACGFPDRHTNLPCSR